MTTGVSTRRRVERLLRTGSPRTVALAAWRELVVRRHEASLTRAIRAGGPLLAGPFLGEVGYELLYWIPFLRRLFREQGVDRSRVTVLTRGGAGSWYRDFAEHRLDLLDLVTPDDYVRALVVRRRREGHAKQVRSDAFDERLTALARERVGHAAVVHPLLMYSRLRFVWEGLVQASAVTGLVDYRALDVEALPVPEQCPADYVAVKLYFSDAFPDADASRALASDVLARLAADHDLVVLGSGTQLDEHREWLPQGARYHDSSAWLTPRDNLEVQTALIARARGLVSTYGGFSYLGPLAGVRTLALQIREPHPASRAHLEVLREAFPSAQYEVVENPDAAAVRRFASGVAT